MEIVERCALENRLPLGFSAFVHLITGKYSQPLAVEKKLERNIGGINNFGLVGHRCNEGCFYRSCRKTGAIETPGILIQFILIPTAP